MQSPIKDGIPNLREFHKIAEEGLKSLEIKLEKQSNLKQQYHVFMHHKFHEYHKLNHMPEVSAIK